MNSMPLYTVLAFAALRLVQGELCTAPGEGSGFNQTEYIYSVNEKSVNSPESLCRNVELPTVDSQTQSPDGWALASTDEFPIYVKDSAGRLCLENRDSLDRDMTERYNFNYTLRYPGDSGTQECFWTRIVLILEDDNDNSPIFDPNPGGGFTVAENTPLGTVVATVHANDIDKDLNGAVKYSLFGCNGTFSIDEVSGNITVSGSIDYDAPQKQTSFDCSVVATDSAVNSPRFDMSPFTVTVIDINDNAPRCVKKQVLNVTENTNVLGVICKLVEDIDGEPNNAISNVLIVYNFGGNFSAEISFTTLFISSNTSLDYEEQAEYDVVIQVSDQGEPPQSTNITARVIVLDENDNPPRCPAMQVVRVNETARGCIASVNCSDADVSSVLVYTLQGSYRDGAQLAEGLVVVNDSGVVMVDENVLDYEREGEKSILLELTVSDGVDTVSTSVKLDIVNVDDNDPVFNSSMYNFNVTENDPGGTFVGRVTASDADVEFNAIRYSIDDQDGSNIYFAVNSTTGIITTKELIRGVQEELTFLVLANSVPKNTRSSSTVAVVVSVLKVKNCLAFNMDAYAFEIRTDSRNGTQVGEILATGDQSSVDNISYRLKFQPSYIVVEFDTGILVLMSSVNQSHVGLDLTFTAIANSSTSSCKAEVGTRVKLTILSLPVQPPAPLPIYAYGVLGGVAVLLSTASLFLCVCIVCCCCMRRQKVMTDSYPISSSPPPRSPPVELRHRKSILKSFTEDPDFSEDRQKNSVRFVEVISADDIHFFDKEAPPSSPGISNGDVSGKEVEDVDSPEPISSPSGGSGLGFDEDSQSLTSDSSLRNAVTLDLNSSSQVNQGYEMDLQPEGYRPPTPPRRRSGDERLPLDFPSAFSPDPLPPASFSRYYSPENRVNSVWYSGKRDMVQLPPISSHDQSHPHPPASQPYYHESIPSVVTSEDRDSLSDNYSTFTEPGTDVGFGGPMESLVSRMHHAQDSRFTSRNGGLGRREPEFEML